MANNAAAIILGNVAIAPSVNFVRAPLRHDAATALSSAFGDDGTDRAATKRRRAAMKLSAAPPVSLIDRHSGAARSAEPGIHTPVAGVKFSTRSAKPVIMDSGPAGFARVPE
jgi:hypothetical protein